MEYGGFRQVGDSVYVSFGRKAVIHPHAVPMAGGCLAKLGSYCGGHLRRPLWPRVRSAEGGSSSRSFTIWGPAGEGARHVRGHDAVSDCSPSWDLYLTEALRERVAALRVQAEGGEGDTGEGRQAA